MSKKLEVNQITNDIIQEIKSKANISIQELKKTVKELQFDHNCNYVQISVVKEVEKLNISGFQSDLLQELKLELKSCIYSYFEIEKIIDISKYPCSTIVSTVDRYIQHTERIELIQSLFYLMNQQNELIDYSKQLLNQCLFDSKDKDIIIHTQCSQISDNYRKMDLDRMYNHCNQIEDYNLDHNIFDNLSKELTRQEQNDRLQDIIQTCGWNEQFSERFWKETISQYQQLIKKMLMNQINDEFSKVKNQSKICDQLVKINQCFQIEQNRFKFQKIGNNLMNNLNQILQLDLTSLINSNIKDIIKYHKLNSFIGMINFNKKDAKFVESFQETIVIAIKDQSVEVTKSNNTIDHKPLTHFIDSFNQCLKFIQSTLSDSNQQLEKIFMKISDNLYTNKVLSYHVADSIDSIVKNDQKLRTELSQDNLMNALSVCKQLDTKLIAELFKAHFLIRLSHTVFEDQETVDYRMNQESVLITLMKKEFPSVHLAKAYEVYLEIVNNQNNTKELDTKRSKLIISMQFRCFNNTNFKEFEEQNNYSINKQFLGQFGHWCEYQNQIYHKGKGKRKFGCNIILSKMELSFKSTKQSVYIQCDMIFAIILLKFNEHNQIQIKNIGLELGLPINKVMELIKILSNLKLIMIDVDKINVNSDYDGHDKIQLESPTNILTFTEVKEGHRESLVEFQQVVNAQIIKTVKKMKSIKMKVLFDMVQKWNAKVSSIQFKERIKALIDDQILFLKRDSQGIDYINYNDS